jgi:branched-chain amino acid transport system substrate-binding protein
MERVKGITLGITLVLLFALTSTVGAADLPKIIKIGAQGVSSGSKADYGIQINYGGMLACDEINAAGGILKKKVEWKFMDSELSAPVAIKNARYLVTEWGAHFLTGIDSSGVSMALAPVMDELNRILIIVHGATHKLNEEAIFKKGHKNVFRISVPTYQEGIFPAKIFKENPEIKRVASLAAAYEYGYSTWEMFTGTMSKYRPDVKFVAKQEAGFNCMDFTPQLTAIMAAKPNMVIATPWGGEAVMMLRQAALLGLFKDPDFKVWFQGMGGSIDLAEAFTPEIKAGVFQGKLWGTARYLWNQTDRPANVAFVKKFREKFGRYPNYSAANTYTAIYAWKKAVEQTKSLDTAKLVKALKGMKIEAPEGIRWIRPEDHQACYSVPLGWYTYDAKVCPNAFLTGLKYLDWKEYYRSPPDYAIP